MSEAETVPAIFDLQIEHLTLDLAGIFEIERVAEAGIWHVADQLVTGTCRVETVQIILKHGFVGAGHSEPDALGLVADHVKPGSLEKCRGICLQLLENVIGEAADAAAEVSPDAMGKPEASEGL